MTGAPPSTRLVGVDIARCLALVGMMATHILPGVRDGDVTTIQQLAGGRASALFAVLAGVSLVLVAGTRDPLTGRRWFGMQAGTFVRALLIGAVGLWLGSLETNIAVILVYYAVLFVVGAPFLALPTVWLAVAAVVSAVAGPALSFVLRRDLPPPSYDVPSPDSLSEPVSLLRELVLTGYYPVATWLPYLLVGLLIGRLDLRSTRVAVRLALTGLAGVAVAVLVSDTYLARPGVRQELIRSYTVPGWQGDLDTSLAHGLYGAPQRRLVRPGDDHRQRLPRHRCLPAGGQARTTGAGRGVRRGRHDPDALHAARRAAAGGLVGRRRGRGLRRPGGAGPGGRGGRAAGGTARPLGVPRRQGVLTDAHRGRGSR
jgi:uncharacterized membrane protein